MVVNTVARARAVFERVRQEADAVLLTGRIRPVDRDYLLAEWLPQIGVERPRPAPKPLVVVATQSIEAGANIDLDALVTESALISSLVQRLGRLNRLGLADREAPALIVHNSTVGDDDPVYGRSRRATWDWLADLTEPVKFTPRLDISDLHAEIAASPSALRSLLGDAPDDLSPRPPHVPLLHKETLDCWVRTCRSPRPGSIAGCSSPRAVRAPAARSPRPGSIVRLRRNLRGVGDGRPGHRERAPLRPYRRVGR